MSARGSAAAAYISVTRPKRVAVPKKPGYSPAPFGPATRSRTSKATTSKVKPSLPLYDPHPDRRSPPLPRKAKVAKANACPPQPECSPVQPAWVCPCRNDDCIHITCPCGLPNSPLIESSSTNQDWISCENSCYQCFHRECVGLSKKQYNALISSLSRTYVCHSCNHKEAVKHLPPKIRDHFAACILQSPLVPVVVQTAESTTPPRSSTQSPKPHSPPNLWLSDSTDDPPTVERPTPRTPTPPSVPDTFFAPDTPLAGSVSTSSTDTDIPSLQLPPPLTRAPIAETTLSSLTPPPVKSDIKFQSINPKNIVILDRIKSPAKFHNSKAILKAVNESKPELKVDFAYPLTRGGIALHCSSSPDRAVALHPWQEGSFGSENVIPHVPTGSSHGRRIIIRDIPRCTTDSEIKDILENHTNIECTKIHRYFNHRHNSYMPIASATFKEQLPASIYRRLLSEGVQIANTQCHLKVEPFKTSRITRCYSCQAFGHIAKACVFAKKCVECASVLSPSSSSHICNEIKCCNCSSAFHTADSKFCPEFKKYLSIISIRDAGATSAPPPME